MCAFFLVVVVAVLFVYNFLREFYGGYGYNDMYKFGDNKRRRVDRTLFIKVIN